MSEPVVSAGSGAMQAHISPARGYCPAKKSRFSPPSDDINPIRRIHTVDGRITLRMRAAGHGANVPPRGDCAY